MQIGRLADAYNVPPHEVRQWDWRTREYNAMILGANEAFQAEKQYERRQEQRKKSKKGQGASEPEPPEHGFDFSGVGQSDYVVTESGKKISRKVAEGQNVVTVQEEADEDNPNQEGTTDE